MPCSGVPSQPVQTTQQHAESGAFRHCQRGVDRERSDFNVALAGSVDVYLLRSQRRSTEQGLSFRKAPDLAVDWTL